MTAVVRAVVDPGSRLHVRFGDSLGRDSERLAGWPIDDESWIVATLELLLVEEMVVRLITLVVEEQGVIEQLSRVLVVTLEPFQYQYNLIQLQ